MRFMPKILLTSEVDLAPLMRRIVDKIAGLQAADLKVAGLIKLERQTGKKKEIIIQDLDGEETVVGYTGKGKGKRIGKFVIDEGALKEAVVQAISYKQGSDLFVIHEIGPLETISRDFSVAAKMLLKKDDLAVLATVSKQGRGFVREAKRLPGVNPLEVTEENQAAIEEQILKELLTAFAKRAREDSGGGE